MGRKDGYFDMIFEFDHIHIWQQEKEGQLDVLKLKHALSAWQTSLDGIGWNALYMENHDVPRAVSVFGDTRRVLGYVCKSNRYDVFLFARYAIYLSRTGNRNDEYAL